MISISVDNEQLIDAAQQLADELALPFTKLNPTDTQLVLTASHIEIRANDLGKPIFIDFEAGKNAHRRQFGGGRGQPLAKAIGLKKGATPVVIDVTAGFGRDAFVLATLGCKVRMVERQPLIACLLEDALQRARINTDILPIIERMSLVKQDALHYLGTLNGTTQPEVIYMDPMYPTREKSALVKKDMRLLHQLAGPDIDSKQLLSESMRVALKRVVVKRPKGAEFVGQQKPATSIESKNTRYDIYLTNNN
jgi:16S rRNA (guanine1516-N2)-methyltransferase